MFKSSGNRNLNESVGVFGPATIIAILGFVIAYQFVDPAPPRHITIATGSPQGAYFKYGQDYRSVLQTYGITLEVVATAGSIENLQLLTDKSTGVDVAFFQGGVPAPENPEDITSLGSLYYEPLWVFYTEGLGIERLADLGGRRIAAGANGSGTRILALELLKLNGVTEQSTEILAMGGEQAAGQLQKGEIEAAFFVTAYHSPFVQQLLRTPNVRLMSFERAEAYTMNLHYLSRVKLARGAIDFQLDIPSEDVHLLAPTTQLVARADFHPALIDLMLQTAVEIHHPGGLFETTGEFPAPKYLDFRLSKEADRFYKSGLPFLRRYLPFWVATFISRTFVMLVPLLALLFPLIRIMPPIYRWRFRSKIYRWYRKLATVDPALQKDDLAGKRDEYLVQLDRLEKQVCQTAVPLSFSNELYHLRLHIKMLRDELMQTEAETGRESMSYEGDHN